MFFRHRCTKFNPTESNQQITNPTTKKSVPLHFLKIYTKKLHYMKISIKKIVLVAFAAGICGTVSAQSLKNAVGNVIISKKSENTYEVLHSGIMSFKIEGEKYWKLDNEISVPQQNNHNGYCVYSNGEYVYYSRSNNIVASYNSSQGRYYLHTAEGDTILKSASYAVLSSGVLLVETGTDTPLRYTVDEGFDPVIIGFYLFSSYIIH